MLILFISFILCKEQKEIDFYEFDKEDYAVFRDNLEVNHFMISLVTNNTKTSKKYQFYKDFFVDISNYMISNLDENVKISFSVVYDRNLKVNYDATFLIYLKGMTEIENDIYPRLSVEFNTHKLLNQCLNQAIKLRRLEKAQKSPEIARIKEEIRELARNIRNCPKDDPKYSKYLNDFNMLVDELMQYISEDKQKEKKLKLQYLIYKPSSNEAKSIQKELKKIQDEKEKKQKKVKELSPKQLEKLTQKNMINELRASESQTSIGVLKSLFVAIYRFIKEKIIYLWNHRNQTDEL